jgi:hypothetical protein
MKNKFIINCFVLLGLFILPLNAIADNKKSEQQPIYSAINNLNLPIYNWQDALSAPKSTPIRLVDEFTKETYAVVIDENFESNFLNGDKKSLTTLWASNSSRGFVKALFYIRIGNRCAFINCSQQASETRFISLEIKVGNEVITTTNLTDKGSFILTSKDVDILRNASGEENAKIRLTSINNESYIYEIGVGTVKSWKIIFKQNEK